MNLFRKPRPSLSVDDVRNVPMIYAKHFAEFALPNACLVHRPDLNHIGFRKFCKLAFVTSWRCAMSNLVHVVLLSGGISKIGKAVIVPIPIVVGNV